MRIEEEHLFLKYAKFHKKIRGKNLGQPTYKKS